MKGLITEMPSFPVIESTEDDIVLDIDSLPPELGGQDWLHTVEARKIAVEVAKKEMQSA
jgi:hypothetical protein